MPVSQVSLQEKSIRYVKGVGPHRATQLAQLGIETLEDACYYPPSRHEDRTHLSPIGEAVPGQPVTIRGRLQAKTLRRIRGGQTIFEASVEDGSGVLYATWFHQPYLAQQLKVGEEFVLYGKLEPGTRRQIIHPEIERVEEGEERSAHMGRIVPIYPLISGIGQRWLRQVIATVLEEHADALEDPLPAAMRQARGWPGVSEAVRELHFPSSWEQLERAQQRLSFEELFIFQVALAQRKARSMAKAKPQRYRIDDLMTQGLRRSLPFRLTADQERVLEETLADLRQMSPMHRLLQGEVGCGKTIILIFLMAVAVQSGYQVVLMAPTELLAEQHARVAAQYLKPLGVSVGLLSQGVPPAERKARAEAIASGTLQVVIGTHALIQTGITFKRLALVLIDEQHKFGVVQRAHLAKKAEVADVLVVTATPIPRTLALSAYGDLDISTIAQLPAGRRPITTQWMPETQRHDAYLLTAQQVAQGRQAYVVYPLVEERETSDLKAASQMARRLQRDIFPQCKVGLLHGQMAPAEKEKTMAAFVRGEVQILVSTVIVEVGLDVPNATVMLIEHPERFGLAQLHQLRGRIGRGAHPASCLLVGDARDAAVTERLTTFARTTDGFELAEKDLELRGPGELLGRRQHGWVRFRLANLSRDRSLLESARNEAAAIISRDPKLQDPSLAALRARLAARQPG